MFWVLIMACFETDTVSENDVWNESAEEAEVLETVDSDGDGVGDNADVNPGTRFVMFLPTTRSIAKRYSRSIEEYERSRNGKGYQEIGKEESIFCLGTIAMAKLWCPGMVV